MEQELMMTCKLKKNILHTRQITKKYTNESCNYLNDLNQACMLLHFVIPHMRQLLSSYYNTMASNTKFFFLSKEGWKKNGNLRNKIHHMLKEWYASPHRWEIFFCIVLFFKNYRWEENENLNFVLKWQ